MEELICMHCKKINVYYAIDIKCYHVQCKSCGKYFLILK